ncbi:MAG: hypothetical protein CNLJKLNK_00489 [Holosporales bacterium]
MTYHEAREIENILANENLSLSHDERTNSVVFKIQDLKAERKILYPQC